MKVFTAVEKGWSIEFSYSPLFEMLCSLHVLSKPDHHLERLAWAEEMRKSLPDKLFEGLMEYGRRTQGWCPVMDLCNIWEECNDFNAMAALNFVEDLPVSAFKEVFSKYSDTGEMDFDSDSIKRMIRLLKEYYLGYFDRELRFIEPLLVRRLSRDSDICKGMGVLEYINGMHDRIEVTDKAILFHKFTLFTIPLDTLKRVIIRISSFIDPHLLMDYGSDMVQLTIRAHLEKGKDEVPRDLLRVMKALSDETRLKILRTIYGSKASTQSLAKELNITEAGISKHLKILYDAELLYKERCGSYIYYYLNTSQLDMIPLEIYECLNFAKSR